MYTMMGQQHSFEDRLRLSERNRENNEGNAKRTKTDNGQDRDRTPRCNAEVAIVRPLRILGRHYPLTKTAYKHLDISINVSRPSFIEIIFGDCHGKEILLTPDTWKELLDLRLTLSYFQVDERDESRLSAPIQIGQLTLRFGRFNNLRILRLETSKIRLAISKNTILYMLNLEHCISRIVTSLNGLTAYTDNKMARFLDVIEIPRRFLYGSRSRARSRGNTRQRELRSQ
ncbi:uncharacterized protein LOC126851143 isoform X1 [Cataglyphis hispanica]|uniref:uncharacterized protein LOC126851143 isoform X1 n=1 Tax=Cataglyphis hispanica TaxID=1086592 RepID=UPI0021801615|nr:uncharacterized protein LOC126851143 isoform X1 [Cataglyphis hispanica]XP_050450769.1 uncharacterized protein LOC126851143 isoform X1 [Cataglyphis hispanica]